MMGSPLLKALDVLLDHMKASELKTCMIHQSIQDGMIRAGAGHHCAWRWYNDRKKLIGIGFDTKP
jgi:hypothetical protein